MHKNGKVKKLPKWFSDLVKKTPKMIGYKEVSDDQKAIIEAATSPGFGTPGMTLKQRIAAAEAIFKKLKKQTGDK